MVEKTGLMKMGEVVVSSEGGMDIELETEKDGSSEVVRTRWESFLPRMVLRVLLVEADDSTRQIISALLRKCSYRGFSSSSFLFHFYF